MTRALIVVQIGGPGPLGAPEAVTCKYPFPESSGPISNLEWMTLRTMDFRVVEIRAESHWDLSNLKQVQLLVFSVQVLFKLRAIIRSLLGISKWDPCKRIKAHGFLCFTVFE